MPGTSRPAALAAVLAAAALMAGCGSDDDDGAAPAAAARPAPPASDFPAPQGLSLEQLLVASAPPPPQEGEVGASQGPVVSPAARVLNVGENRFPFGVFTVEQEPITDAEVAIYAAPENVQGPAQGPYPARIESLETEPAFRAEGTAQDPDAAKVVYVSEVPLPQRGKWAFAALVKEGDSYSGTLIPTPSLVGALDPVGVGDEAPRVSTPVAGDVAQISEIDTRVPPGTMHDEDLQDVLGRKPVVLLFATPALCQSRVCGPVVDIAEQVKRDYEGEGIAWVHQEIYNDNDLQKGARPQVEAYRLPSEPWLYVIDRDGRVSTVIEGAFSVEELNRAVRRVSAPS